LLGLCVIVRSFSVGVHDGCRIAVVRRNFSGGEGLVNCEAGQQEFVLPFLSFINAVLDICHLSFSLATFGRRITFSGRRAISRI
jgi:hypothetical protein